jgi:thioredoxin 1
MGGIAPAAQPDIETVGRETFDARVLEAPGPIVVEFMSYGCSHCRALEPVLKQVAGVLADRERIVRVNVAADPELAECYGIRVTPTMIMFRDGAEVGRAEGPQPVAASLLAALRRPFENAADAS